jgi:Fe-S cluster biogenesis protein NfuA
MIQETIEREVRPALRKDGGDLELIDVEGDTVIVSMRGNCAQCRVASFTLRDVVQAKLREFEAWAEPERQRVEALQARMNDLRQQINQQSAVAAEEALQELRQRELDARREFEEARRAFQRQLEAKQNEFLGDVAVKVGTVASEYGQANGYDAIFVLNAQPLVYVAESADITDTIIKLYDERYPLTGE